MNTLTDGQAAALYQVALLLSAVVIVDFILSYIKLLAAVWPAQSRPVVTWLTLIAGLLLVGIGVGAFFIIWRAWP